MKVRNPMFVIVPSVAIAAGLGVFSYVGLANYFVALGWHLRHGNHTVIRGYRVPVPLLWWRVDYYGGNIGLVRAAPGNPGDGEGGAVEWDSLADSNLVATEDQALVAAQRDASHPIFTDKPGDVILLVQLRRGKDTIYCVREDISYFSNLDCHLAGAPVVFRYTGDPEFEKTAESILSSMQ